VDMTKVPRGHTFQLFSTIDYRVASRVHRVLIFYIFRHDLQEAWVPIQRETRVAGASPVFSVCRQ
jgi:hypothetical protein